LRRVRAVRLQHGVCNLKPHGAALLAKLCLAPTGLCCMPGLIEIDCDQTSIRKNGPPPMTVATR
jgi:hypothetical protein